MAKAMWNNTVLAESDKTIIVEGNHYFPPDSLNRQFFHQSTTHSLCPWKGQAFYYDIQIDGQVNRDAAWFYPKPSSAAAEIKDYVAFWKGVRVEK